ncbi:hypothetical protein BCV70DRAFT_68830 [Testicularia cyperi]|uniref:Uncharacterized protein n=1 Tax=Testicularia cyperi TaxID=1882483 RepID=A0A317XFY8_9BASI|nr:hypothetical protein BCV70DRAFT_68830 [Testicularia cyperi]
MRADSSSFGFVGSNPTWSTTFYLSLATCLLILMCLCALYVVNRILSCSFASVLSQDAWFRLWNAHLH